MLSGIIFSYGDGDHRDLHVLTLSFPTRRSSDLSLSRARGGAYRPCHCRARSRGARPGPEGPRQNLWPRPDLRRLRRALTPLALFWKKSETTIVLSLGPPPPARVS